MMVPRRFAPLAFFFPLSPFFGCGSTNSSSDNGSSDDQTATSTSTSTTSATTGAGGSQASGTASTTSGAGGNGTTSASGGTTGSTGGAAGDAGNTGTSNTNGGTDSGSTGSAGAGGSSESCEGFPSATYPSCTSQQDCNAGTYCRFPGDPQACGVPCFQDRQCESDDDCGDGVCQEFTASCCEEGTLSSQCVAACTESSCPDGTTCGGSGHCECTDDGCGVNQACESVNGGLRSCMRRRCNDIADCDCGVCSDGLCTPPPDVGYCDLAVP